MRWLHVYAKEVTLMPDRMAELLDDYNVSKQAICYFCLNYYVNVVSI
jgi:hypothetical protein